MRLTKRTLLAAMAFTAFAGTATSASADRWVKIVNHTSVVVYRFYASPTSSNSWGSDRLGSKQVPSGYTSTINLNSAGKGCYFDIRAEFADGDVLEKSGIDVCNGYTITYSD